MKSVTTRLRKAYSITLWHLRIMPDNLPIPRRVIDPFPVHLYFNLQVDNLGNGKLFYKFEQSFNSLAYW